MATKKTGYKIRTIKDLSRHIAVDEEVIRDLICALESNETGLYKSSQIPKRNGGTRTIDNPCPKLKLVQKNINGKILQRIKIHNAASGGVKGKRLREFLEIHCGKPMVMAFDLKDFFPNTKQTNVYKMFCNLGMSPHVAKILTSLTTYKGRLPQGAPTSPMISNIIAGYGKSCLDARFEGLCKKHDSEHGRWIDDIPISGPSYLPKIKPVFKKIVQQCGFIVNAKKEENAIHPQDEAQIITGHCVNKKPNVLKSVRKKMRAELHRRNMGNFEAIKNIEREKHSLRGRIAHFQSINPELGNKFLSEFMKIQWPIDGHLKNNLPCNSSPTSTTFTTR